MLIGHGTPRARRTRALDALPISARRSCCPAPRSRRLCSTSSSGAGSGPASCSAWARGCSSSAALDDPREARLRTVGTPLATLDEFRILEPGTERRGRPSARSASCAAAAPTRSPATTAHPSTTPSPSPPDGFYRTGDLARWGPTTASAHLHIEGRIKDVINRGGEKVNAEEVELLLLKHPAIAQAAVVAMPDARLGRTGVRLPVAAGAARRSPTCKRHLDALGVAKFKWPERVSVRRAAAAHQRRQDGQGNAPQARRAAPDVGSAHVSRRPPRRTPGAPRAGTWSRARSSPRQRGSSPSAASPAPASRTSPRPPGSPAPRSTTTCGARTTSWPSSSPSWPSCPPRPSRRSTRRRASPPPNASGAWHARSHSSRRPGPPSSSCSSAPRPTSRPSWRSGTPPAGAGYCASSSRSSRPGPQPGRSARSTPGSPRSRSSASATGSRGGTTTARPRRTSGSPARSPTSRSPRSWPPTTTPDEDPRRRSLARLRRELDYLEQVIED